MRSIKFPEMFTRTVTNTVSDYDATLQNLKLLLWSEKGELFGDPYYGAGFKKYIYDQNDFTLYDLIIDDIYTAIALFMPQIRVDRRDIKVNREDKDGIGKLTATIKCTNMVDFTTDLYTIVLEENEA